MLRKLTSLAIPSIFFTIIFIGFPACKSDKGKGNIVTARLMIEPERLNQLTTEDAAAIQVMSNIYQFLLDIDPKTFDLVPVLAQSRPTIAMIDTGAYKGGMAYTYTLRDEATWDNGKPILADDVLFTIKTIMNKYSGADNYRTSIEFVKDVVKDMQNPKKFTVICNTRNFLGETKISTFPIFPEYVYDTEGVLKNISLADIIKAQKDSTSTAIPNLKKIGALFLSPKFQREKEGIIGSGAYTITSWTPGQSIILQKKNNWWGDKLVAQNPILTAAPDQLVYKIVKDNATAVSLMKNEELDAVMSLPTKDFAAMKADPKMAAAYNFEAVPALSLAYIGFNCKNPQLTDKRVRRAIAHLVDIPTIIKTVMGGFGEPCASAFVPQREYYNKELQIIDLNIEKAKALLSEAGWKDTNADSTIDKSVNGKKSEMVLRYIFASANEPAKNMGLMLQENAKKVGIKVQLEPIEAKAMQDYFKKRDYDMFVNAFGFEPTIDDPKEVWSTSANTPSGGNRCQFENKQADALMEQIRTELDREKRNVLYQQFQALIYEEQPAVFLFGRLDRVAVNKRFDAAVVSKRPGYVPSMFKLKAN
jgi:peptide/nickel transport system substrate-binding protein